MAVDTSNNARVDLADIYREAEQKTALASRMIQDNELADKIIITPDDYHILNSYMNEATSQIAEVGNYVATASQTGLEAITNHYTEEEPNPYTEEELINLKGSEKKDGELLSKGEMDTLTFELVPELTGKIIYKWTIVQTYIRSALIEYILFKWYKDNRMNEDAAICFEQYNVFLEKIRMNSILNIKSKLTRRPFNYL